MSSNKNSGEEKDLESLLAAENYSKDILEEKYEELIENRGIVVLPVDHSATAQAIIDTVKGKKDLRAFVIYVDGEKYVVFKYRVDSLVGSEVIKSTVKKADYEFYKGNYKESIELCKNLMQYLKRPSAGIYYKAGVAYYKIGQNDQAINYLLMAAYARKKDKKDYTKFTDLIDDIRFGKIEDADRKKRVKMREDDFTTDELEYYRGINNFSEINDYIILTGADVETACKQFGLSPEATDIVYLIYSREFYLQNNVKMGDRFLRAYESSDRKTKKSKRFYTEIQNNKKVYINRPRSDDKRLLLTLRPKSKNNENTN